MPRSMKIAAARGIARALRPSEDNIDSSIVTTARLVASLVEARLQSGVAAEIGHSAFMHAAAGLASLAEARDRIVSCHRECAEVRDAQGIDPGEAGCTLKVARHLESVPSGVAEAA